MSCAADGWAHGSWERVGSNATPCGAFAYVNDSCLSPLSLGRLTRGAFRAGPANSGSDDANLGPVGPDARLIP